MKLKRYPESKFVPVLPLVLTNGLEVKLSGALAPLTEQIKIKKNG